MIDTTDVVAVKPAWWTWLESGSVGLPPEPPADSRERWRPDWSWGEIVLGLYCAYVAYVALTDIMRWRVARATE